MHPTHSGRRCERGQVTAEYAVGAVGAVAVAGVLFGPEPIVADWLAEFVLDHLARSFSLTLPELFRWPW
ncbi:DUF4244 domain-containing protein [Aeromicrobium duanguangcaii]|uniref:DUF4244 domain-containing protein n=1 Tax=Aeromicrobium duanguangcaii TaxID=2968086 RepID=A0ABY5KG31_9ACTN|nr:DUF4244 domain-containing protein [Aeromicrobium duanguangcaii]MCD9154211.1 DUF4244 domain-containing protein [Aeromicrobium duanguangcaii]MCL3837945.1 DUF4244 domain-containing protein [Aeromicrobium duanguangcaii]UUI68718.1 DUF4244 domain-containing protein [Aeromicrobium duanguangcaii]